MTNLIRAEMYKLQRNKTFWVLIGSITGLSSLLHFLVMIDWWQLSGTGFEKAGLSEFNALSVFILPLLFNLIVSALAGFYICTEFSQGSVIKNQIISGNKRRQIFMAKYLVFTLGAFIVTILIPLVTAIIMAIILGQGEIFTASSLMYLGRAYSLYTLQFLSFTVIVLLLSIVTEDNGKTILFSLLLSILMFIIEKFITSPIVKIIYELTFFYQFSDVFKATLTGGELVKSVLVGIVSFIVLILYGMAIFNKKEIK